MPGTLYIVATPIGNLQDMTARAIEMLRSVDVIACEDTRHTRKLLNAYDISNKLVSYHEHNEQERSDELGRLLIEGKSAAIVSDAGTPGINDPGFRLVTKAHEIGARVVPIPGAVAFVNAVIASGLPTDSIFFGGFLPAKTGERKKRLLEVKNIRATLVFYETPHRIEASIEDCLNVLGDRKASIARELTKLHEQIITGKLSFLRSSLSSARPRGEYVLVIAGDGGTGEAEPKQGNIADRISELEAEGMDRKSALKLAAKEFGLSRSEAYRDFQNQRTDN